MQASDAPINGEQCLAEAVHWPVPQIELDEDEKEVELGKGAFGLVVKGRYRLMPVAIKRLLNQLSQQQAQFLKEMAIMRACRGSRQIMPFVGASLQPVRFLPCPSCWAPRHHVLPFMVA